MGLAYHILDVFSETPFGGNPLVVVLDADELTSEQMQSIANEFNLSETVFVLTAQKPGHTARVRIFTPSRELPFAGHPTIGTAALLAELRAPAVNGERDAIIVLEEEIGSVRVGVRLKDGGAAHAGFDAPKQNSSLSSLSEIEPISAALGLIPSEIGFENHKPVLRNAPTNFAYVPIANLDAMAKVAVASTPWRQAFTEQNVEGVYLYTRDCVRNQSAFHARMLAPDLGVPEDPATGAAAIGFAETIHRFDDMRDGTHTWLIEQGIEMGRPSAIQLSATIKGGELSNVRISGATVRVAEGSLRI